MGGICQRSVAASRVSSSPTRSIHNLIAVLFACAEEHRPREPFDRSFFENYEPPFSRPVSFSLSLSYPLRLSFSARGPVSLPFIIIRLSFLWRGSPGFLLFPCDDYEVPRAGRCSSCFEPGKLVPLCLFRLLMYPLRDLRIETYREPNSTSMNIPCTLREKSCERLQWEMHWLFILIFNCGRNQVQGGAREFVLNRRYVVMVKARFYVIE